MHDDTIRAEWRRPGCVGGDCDTRYPPTTYRGRPGRIVILEEIDAGTAARLEHQPAAHERAVFLPGDFPQD